jgi:dTDP-4-amino-4,6-dideoxygalactose transaminase
MSNKYQYNSWPIGKLPIELQRPELDKIKINGYCWEDPRDVIDLFEQKVACFANAKHAITVDCCSHGIFLSLKYLQHIKELPNEDFNLKIPSRTYASAPMQIIHSGLGVSFEDIEWSGVYQLKGSRVWDGAVRWTKDMYVGNNSLQVVSFQMKKRIPIGKGGIILTDDYDAYKWLKLASYDGRNLTTPYNSENHISMIGYHMYMTPEDAARGILLMDAINEKTEIHEDTGTNLSYTDISKIIDGIKK